MKKLALVCAVFAIGCGGGSSGVTIDQFPQKAASAICSQNFKCCDASELAGKTMATCVSNNELALSLLASTVSDAQSKGRASYSAAQMGTCLNGITSLSCADWKSTGDPTNSAACVAAITPKVDNGGACQQPFECKSGNCVGATTTSTGTPVDGMCMPAPSTIAIGQPCTVGSSTACVTGAYCDGTSMTCKAKKVAGQTCDPNGSGDECTNSCDTATSKCTCYVGCSVAGPVTAPGAALSLALLALAMGGARLRRGRRRP